MRNQILIAVALVLPLMQACERSDQSPNTRTPSTQQEGTPPAAGVPATPNTPAGSGSPSSTTGSGSTPGSGSSSGGDTR